MVQLYNDWFEGFCIQDGGRVSLSVFLWMERVKKRGRYGQGWGNYWLYSHEYNSMQQQFKILKKIRRTLLLVFITVSNGAFPLALQTHNRHFIFFFLYILIFKFSLFSSRWVHINFISLYCFKVIHIIGLKTFVTEKHTPWEQIQKNVQNPHLKRPYYQEVRTTKNEMNQFSRFCAPFSNLILMQFLKEGFIVRS